MRDFIRLIGVIAALIAATPAWAVTIDSFESGDESPLVVSGRGADTASRSESGLAGVLEGQRDTYIRKTDPPGNVSAELDTAAGSVALRSSGQAEPLWRFRYDGGGSLRKDLSTKDRFAIKLPQVSGQLETRIEVTDQSGMSSSVTRAVKNPGITEFRFSEFSSSVDFSSVNEIAFEFDAPGKIKAEVSSFSAVPTPGAGSIGLLLFLVLFILYRPSHRPATL